MNALVKIEPIPLPDQRRPTQMPSLPAWLGSQVAALTENMQIDPKTGSYADVVTLPANLIPSPDQKAAIEAHIRSLSSLLEQTPRNSADCEQATLVIVTKLLLVLPGQKTSELGAEAKGEAYMAALDDVPSWAVESAVRRWYRGECGNDDRGHPYDYRWAPDPATLRRLSKREAWIVRTRIKTLEPIVTALPYVDCTQDLERGKQAYAGLMKVINNKDALSELTFEKAMQLANSPAPKQEAEELA